MPKERKDTAPTAQEEDATEVSPHAHEGGGEITAAADQLAAATLADHDEAGSGMSETQQEGVAELHDSLLDPELWKPHPPTEDCPVCLVPLPLENMETAYNSCCGKTVCVACKHESVRALRITNRKREKKELPPLDASCAFCREPVYKDDLELIERMEKRVAKGDVEAILSMALCCQDGLKGFPKDEAKGKELLEKAADMGCAKAVHQIGYSYIKGTHGFPRDGKRSIGYFVNGVEMGNTSSRCALAAILADKGNYYLANKHLRLAAEAGDENAVKQLWQHFSDGKLSKKDLEEILRTHQAAYNEMDSEDRQRFDARNEALTGNDKILKGLYGSYYFGYTNAEQLRGVLKMHQKGCGLEEIREFLRKCGVTDTIVNK